MATIKVNMVCDKCGKSYTRSKSRMNDHSLCRSCHMKESYSQKPGWKEIAIEKRKVTTLEKYGVENVAQSEKVQAKEKATRLEKYGYEKPFMNKVAQKSAQVLAHSIDAEQKRKDSCLEKYGETHHMKNKDILDRVVQNHGKIGSTKGYFYNDIHFDSSWELAYYIWLTDHKKQFVYHSKLSFTYTGEDGEDHECYPDFLVEGKFFEIKGTQFFNEKSEPYNLYTKSFWWGKYQALIENNVTILKQEDMKQYLEYVSNKYGKTFLKEHRKNKKGDTKVSPV